MFYDFPIRKVLNLLEKDDLLPTILFRSSRRQCNDDVKALDKFSRRTLSSKESEKIEQHVNKVIEKYQIDDSIIKGHEQYESLIMHGVGAHHAGQLLVWRLLLEELMSAGVMIVMVATGTVAAGVDFPARSVVVTSHSKRDSEGFRVLKSSELQQMSGRAGRRGKDKVGFCLVAPGPYCDARQVGETSLKPPEPLKSAYYASPSTILNLLKYQNIDHLNYTVEKSLASFHDRKRSQAMLIEAEKLEASVEEQKDKIEAQTYQRRSKRVKRIRRDAGKLLGRQIAQLDETSTALTTLGFIDSGNLTEKGVWAANLYTNRVLEIANAIEAGLLKDVDYRMASAIVASISGDSHRTYYNLQDNPVPKDIFEELKELVKVVQEAFPKESHTSSINIAEVVPDAALTVLVWLESKSWDDFSSLLTLAGCAPGDISRLVTQTAENLNQVSRLSLTHPKLALVASEARMKLLRPPLVDSY